MNNRLRDLKTAEAEVHTLSTEREHMVEEMELMKSRVREMMLEKLSAERKMSEAIARNTRNEVRTSDCSSLHSLPSAEHHRQLEAQSRKGRAGAWSQGASGAGAASDDHRP
jgi:hypothetical protein